jgi:mono/diheme cytochrome c family protein
MIRKKLLVTACIIAAIVSLNACYYHKADVQYPFVCDTTNVRYKVEIKAILDANCKSCHNGPDITGYDLYDHATISSLALDGNFTYGTLLSAVMHEGGAPEMPQGGPKLQDCDINKIAAWVHKGAPDN